MKYCKKCIMPTSRPGITLNEEGICGGCLGFKEKKEEIDWKSRGKELDKILDTFRSKGDYDCLIPVSGGKDSTWQVYTMLQRGMKPLAITIKCQYRTELGQRNLDNLISLGVDHIDFTVNPEIDSKFMLKTFEQNGNPSLVEHLIMWSTIIKTALRYNINLIVWAENSALEYGGSKDDRNKFRMDYDWIKKYGVTNGTVAEDWIDENITLKDISSYQLPYESELNKAGIENLFLGMYMEWEPEDVAKKSQTVGFEWAENPVLGLHPFVGVDCDFRVVHHFMKWYKFGLTKLWDNLAIEIREGRMTRDESVEYLKNNEEPIPNKEIESFCSYLNISIERFYELAESHRNLDIWEKDEYGSWYLPAFKKEFGFWKEFLK
ncbi:N-acetyl sugar amidotransferase [Sulfurimonas sp.]|uniref:N-acetyl sugar amidotransferase n=1 Tax=Sulfurimonas sp. TaxID=2022749 RepID=UPI002630BC70|nr:N-acetyl sugar amidotransferase [Sulfurimonas sp.]MCW8895337.1 N-acetyl sugar amidotransferase [Sulfurimonas sp.]